MKVSTLATLFTFISIAVASNPYNARHAAKVRRQAPPSASGSATAGPSASGSPGAPPQPSGSGASSAPLPPAGNQPPLTGLAGITSGMPPKPTLPVTATYSRGEKPPYENAPPLPKPFVFQPGHWPPQDRVPDITSPEVQEWMKELDGFEIPELEPTADGSCASSPEFARDAEKRGWWSCGGWVRPTDVVACPDKYTWGVSFDDGPSPYTTTLLKYLDEKKIKSTFFVVGSRVIERPQVLLDEYMTGHEISVHTWSHRPLTSLTTEQIVAELGWTRKAIRDVLGVTPTTMRPPYGDIDDRVRAITLAMGMEPIMWTRAPSSGSFDTFDWRVPAGLNTGTEAVTQFQKILSEASMLNTGFIVLQHDLYEITVELAAHYFIEEALRFTPKLTLEPIGKCLHRPTANLYLETTANKSFPYPDSVAGKRAGQGNGAVSTTGNLAWASILAMVVAAFVQVV